MYAIEYRMTSKRPDVVGADKPVRLLHVIGHPIQYFAPLYRALSSRPHIELTVCFYSDEGLRPTRDPGFGQDVQWDVPLVEGYRSWFLTGHEMRNSSRRFSPVQVFEVARAILAERFDVVWIHGYSSVDTWLIVACCHIRGIPVFIREEATLLDRRPPGTRLLKALLLPILFRLIYGLYIGVENRKFFERYGVRGDRLFPAPYCVDNEYFRLQAKHLMDDRPALRRSFGLQPDYPVVLFCGKLIPKKDPVGLLLAFEAVRRQVDSSLLFAGDGPLREQLAAIVRQKSIPNVQISGFLNQSEISRAYALADVIALPSRERETWGLVINEAMNFSLAAVVSDKVGCASDLVFPGTNGSIVASASVVALADALGSILTDSGKCRALGANSQTIVNEYDVPKTARAIAEAVTQVARRKRRRMSPAPVDRRRS